ncbi:MAG TPA: hypothetical protein PK858_03910 [Saprospiraceae bacterium]|nr:hypothetical protein [Saprospiraceae bacterium]
MQFGLQGFYRFFPLHTDGEGEHLARLYGGKGPREVDRAEGLLLRTDGLCEVPHFQPQEIEFAWRIVVACFVVEVLLSV